MRWDNNDRPWVVTYQPRILFGTILAVPSLGFYATIGAPVWYISVEYPVFFDGHTIGSAT